ncbi:hypothetical protein CTA2_1278 [Colletotrichum tanaceti]|uniref:Hypersensitive response-inducing protein n=1 Tax=Colletotrichum tanaceti TaxID=1306861 RepID=A0A4U6X9K9_9PEZI|nr:hypothetical protein CTA2_1275 [Colletotrichum tanaceti]KAJ0167667.1 hypothetical protein CTA2_1278 [Colletotrichum tanaceti]TKW50307.1 hypothetical protein CTA1_7023 [Colletotrichum tanaceti]
MKFAAVLSCAAVAAAAAVGKRDITFKVSDFSADCVEHSLNCAINFKVIQPGTMETTPTRCFAVVGAKGGRLPDVVKEGKCETSRTFDLVRGPEGFTFTVSQQVTPASNQTGSRLLPNSDFFISNEPNAVVERYQGPTNFDLV